ncbi:MAG: hypothetical protein RIB60_01095 [Phycisphaerales bacterium]
MRGIWSGMLFGGAIFCAGLGVADARGEVVNDQFRFVGDVSDEYQWDGTYNGYGSPNYVSVGNNSFDVAGGRGILAFDQSAMGGTAYSFPYAREDVRVTGVGAETAGGLDARLSASASIGNAYDFPSGPSATAEMTFTLTSAMSFELELFSFAYDNATGAGGIVLEEIGGPVIYQSPALFASPGVVALGELQAGDYRFVVGLFGNGSGDAELRIFPAPGTAAGLAAFGVLACRRRRH